MPEWRKIIDKATGKVIAGGEVVGEKLTKRGEPVYLFSFDGKHYFGNNTKKYRVDVNYDHVTTPLVIPDDYSVILWKDYIVGMEFDILREYGLDELDEEIKEFVYILNELPGIATKSSCSGHGHGEPFITFNVENTKGVASLSWVLNKLSDPPFVGNIYLSSLNAYTHVGTISFSLRTTSVGEIAWNLLEELGKRLKEDIASNNVQTFVKDFKKKILEDAYHE